MKIKMKVTVTPGSEPVEVATNLSVIAEWERTERRKVTDGIGIGLSDMVCWAHTILKLINPSMPATWREWLEKNPDMNIEVLGDETDPNPTHAAPTAAS
jgi:hypothetical protein